MDQIIPFIINVGIPALVVILVELRMANVRYAIHQKKMFSNIEEILKTVPKIDSIKSKIEHVHEQTHDLWGWHNISGEDGVKLWYVRKSLEVAIRDLTEVLRGVDKKDTEMMRILSGIDNQMDSLKEAIGKCETKLSKMNEEK